MTKHRTDGRLMNDSKRRRLPLITAFTLLLVPASVYGWSAAQSSASDAAVPSNGSGAEVQKLLRVDSSTASPSDQTNQQHTSVSVSTNSTNSTSSSHSVNVDNRSTVSGSGDDGAQATVVINGKTVSLPPSGSLHKNFSDDNGSTSVDVSVNGNGSNTGSTNSSSINLQITNDSASVSDEDVSP